MLEVCGLARSQGPPDYIARPPFPHPPVSAPCEKLLHTCSRITVITMTWLKGVLSTARTKTCSNCCIGQQESLLLAFDEGQKLLRGVISCLNVCQVREATSLGTACACSVHLLSAGMVSIQSCSFRHQCAVQKCPLACRETCLCCTKLKLTGFVSMLMLQGVATVTGSEAWSGHKLFTQGNVLQQQRHVLTFLGS